MSERKPGPEADQTVIRQEPNDDKTNVLNRDGSGDGSDKSASASASDSAGNSPGNGAGEEAVADARQAEPPLLDEATVIRDADDAAAPASGADSTVLREPVSNTSATILKEPGEAASDNSTIMRDPPPSSSSATILRSGEEMRAAGGDSTVLRNEDEDATMINAPGDEDSTVLGEGAKRKSDTTYIANAGKPVAPRGNTEAGRLLKNRFVLEEKVGSGGMGDVYKALDLRQQEAQERNPYIAIKILNESFARHKDAFISLQRETTRTRGIPHPNIMAVYDFDKEGDTVFMSMELLDGKPLDDYLKDHDEGVSVDDAWNIIDGICKGLGRAHDAGIVHSDFKPGNIYYTTDKQAKVFDFGIARAVASPNELEADGEKTVFDAGSLGALTPTYASYEMLKGLEPTKSDDVYAVALVAYELFTGKHPYNRVPADKALERGMVPEPVPNMKRRHWRALRKALELKSEQRTQSIDEFYDGMFSEDPPYFRYAAIAVVLLASVGFGVYQQFFGQAELVPEQFTQRQGLFDGNEVTINDRLKTPNFSAKDWRDQVAESLNRLNIVYKELEADWLPTEWLTQQELDARAKRLANKRLEVMNAYLGEIERLRLDADSSTIDVKNEAVLQEVVRSLEQAATYMKLVEDKLKFDPDRVNAVALQLVETKAKREQALETRLREIEEEKARIAAAEQAEIARAAAEKAEADRNIAYDQHIGELTEILKCKGDIGKPEDMKADQPPEVRAKALNRLGEVITGLRQTYPARYDLDKPGIVNALAGCIEQRIAVRNPSRAREVKARVMTYLPGEQRLAGIAISDLDPCAARTLVGAGNRNRSWCEDKLSVGGTGPELVVIPAKTGASPAEPLGRPFAISRLEVRIGDYNQFCEDTGCQKMRGSASLPVTNISLEQARAYVAWLSDQSGRVYRLPSTDEWLFAATTNEAEGVDDNVNCTVDSRGVRLGEKLLNTLSGRSNAWGLYNFIGNAREWALQGDEIFALGGAHTDPKADCSLDNRVSHSGEPDPVTGFRVIRQI